MAGLFEMFSGTPQSQGLLAAAAQILQASGPSRTPTSLGQILGSGLGAYQQQEQQARQTGQLEQVRGLQIQEAESDLAMKAAQRKRAQELLDFQTAYGKSRGGQPQAASMPAPQSADAMFRGAVAGGMAPQQPALGGAAPAQAAAPVGGAGGGRNALVQERLQYAQALRDNGYSAEANAAEEQALKLQPKVKGWEKVQQDGKVMFAPFFEDGTNGAPVPLEVAEKLNAVNRGGTTELTNAYTGATVRSMENSASPEAVLSAQVQRENSIRQDARAREANATNRQGARTQIITDPVNGPMLIDKATGEARPVTLNGQPVASETATKRANAAKNLMPLIQQAEGLLDGATGSYLGAGADQVVRAFGGATDGAQNIAQLKVLEGNIMMAQPRMEGPQSNMDVALYRQMAAQIGDPTVPNSTKRKALSTLRTMYEKYDVNSPQFSPAAAPVQRASQPAAGNKTVSLADITATARASGRTTKEVTAALRAKGYTIGGQ